MDVLESAKKMKEALFLTLISRLENVSWSLSAEENSGDFFFPWKRAFTVVESHGKGGMQYLHLVLPFFKQLFLCRQSCKLTRICMHAKSRSQRSRSKSVNEGSCCRRPFHIKLSMFSSVAFFFFNLSYPCWRAAWTFLVTVTFFLHVLQNRIFCSYSLPQDRMVSSAVSDKMSNFSFGQDSHSKTNFISSSGSFKSPWMNVEIFAANFSVNVSTCGYFLLISSSCH